MFRIVNSLSSTLIFGLGLDAIFSTSFISYPFSGTNNLVEIGTLSLISLCLFNFVLSLATYRKKRNLAHHACRYLVALSTLGTSLYLGEISICAVVAMVTVGCIFADELKVIKRAERGGVESRSNPYYTFLLFHLAMNYLCQLLFPLLILAFAVAYTKQDFFAIQKSSQAMFFIASTFMVCYSLWRLRHITLQYLNEKTRADTRKLVQVETGEFGFTNICSLNETTCCGNGNPLGTMPFRKASKPSTSLETFKMMSTGDENIEPKFTF